VADAERRKRTHMPAAIGEQTKPAIALSLLDRAREWGVPIQAVVVDAGYGSEAGATSIRSSASRPSLKCP
jgi:SRSO17 transposase